jgi:ubiquinone/menaquinone biosynthesis C-methylase UbiE
MTGMSVPVDSWTSAENARRYAEFARTYTTYRQTSRDLVDFARLPADATVVDLACGTGSTTAAVLSVLGEGGRVVAIDGSAAMLAVARSIIHDERVRWLHSPAERLGGDTVTDVDAVVCNSAIWQTDIRLTAEAVRRALRPGGRFVFNLGAQMLADHAHSDQPDLLVDAMKEIAARDHGWRPTSQAPSRQQLSEAWLRQVLHEAGFTVDLVHSVSYQASLAEQHSWLSVPVFTTGLFPHLPYEQRMAVLNEAYQRLAADRPRPVTTQWVIFTATIPMSGSGRGSGHE